MKGKYQIGGIVYHLLQRKKPSSEQKPDIPSLKSLVSRLHDPVQVEEEIEVGYTPQYKLNRDRVSESSPTTPIQVVSNDDKKPPITQILFPWQMLTSDAQIQPDNMVESNPTSHVSRWTPSNQNEQVWANVWDQYGSSLGLKDDKAYMYILGQLQHESDGFKYMQEIADGSAYEGREDLGNVNKGDGKKYKGRGPIQVTGRSNYEKIYKDFFVPNGLGQYDIVNNPELANDPKIGSLLSLGWLATTDNGKRAIASANNYDIHGLTKAINGGYNGMEDRIYRTNELLKQYS